MLSPTSYIFKSKLISPCDLNGLYLSPEKVEKYLNDLEYNPYNDSSLKSVFNSEPNN